MTTTMRPHARPNCAHFSSGPCAKRPGWTPQALEKAFLGRSHRAKDGKARLKLAIDKTRALLGLPADYLCGIVPASDTGAFELAMWSMLGARGVDVLAWESFGEGWVTDVTKQLKLADVTNHQGAVWSAPRSHDGRFQSRRAVHRQRHDVGRPHPELRLDPGQSRRTDVCGCNFCCVRPARRLVEGRCLHVLLAEGARQ